MHVQLGCERVLASSSLDGKRIGLVCNPASVDGQLRLIAARKHGIKAIVCDRPNPIGGADVEGPMLLRAYESFVGQYPIPMRHGMTIGELARLFNTEFGIGADLEVIEMQGWTRGMYFD